MLDVKLNKQRRVIEIHKNGEIIAVLNPTMANIFFETLKVQKEELRILTFPFEKVSFKDIEKTLEVWKLAHGDLRGINLKVEKAMTLPTMVTTTIEVLLQEGTEMFLEGWEEPKYWDSVLIEDEYDELSEMWMPTIEGNFSPEQVWFGTVKTSEIRNCISNDIFEYMEEDSEFEVRFNGKLIPREELFGKKPERNYNFGENYDT